MYALDMSCLLLSLFFFFFSSRRRHTRCLSDWSSDVCSSDLARWQARRAPRRGRRGLPRGTGNPVANRYRRKWFSCAQIGARLADQLAQFAALDHRPWLRYLQLSQSGRQIRDGLRGAVAGLREPGQRFDEAAAENDGAEQRLALAALAGARHHVARHVAEDLFGAGKGRLVLAVLGGETLDAGDVEFHHFVDRAHVGCVAAGGKLGADAEGIDGRAAGDKVADAVFVQVAAHHDLGAGVACVVEDTAHLAGERAEIAAVQADSPHRAAECGGAAGAFQRVVGVDQVDGGRAEDALEFAEGVGLAGEGHDPGMGGGAHHRDAVPESGERVAGAGAAAEPGGPRAQRAGFGSVRAARAELHHGTPGGGRGAARGFGGDQGLEGDGAQQVGFRDLGFDDGGADGERGFAGEQDGAFGDGEEVAGEAELAEVVEEGGAHLGELGEGAQVGDFLGRKAHVEQVVDDLRDAGDDDVIAIGRQAPDGEFERGLLAGLTGLEVARRHGEFVEIGEKAVHRWYTGTCGAAPLVRAGRPRPASDQGGRPTIAIFSWVVRVLLPSLRKRLFAGPRQPYYPVHRCWARHRVARNIASLAC